ncbi:DUF6296 family protein, partial [Streptomyces sp. NEAU-H3]|uniref:DUF6296 family protein n=1 Tax=Streptomyces sp. NEAU-H3 TaxID=2720636 RepID=UPI001FD78A6D
MQPERYELIFDAAEIVGEPGGGPAAVTVIRTQQTGPSGAPLYRDETGIQDAPDEYAPVAEHPAQRDTAAGLTTARAHRAASRPASPRAAGA